MPSAESGREPSRGPATSAVIATGAAAAALIAAALAVGPIAQDALYHRFADQRSLLGIAHGADVLSNLPMTAAGLAGLLTLLRRPPSPGTNAAAASRLPWILFFLGVSLAGPASAWYHLAPDNTRLFWDRLPMALAFASLLAAVIGEGFGAASGRAALVALVPLGTGSVVWWILTERQGAGDLRWYALTQFLPVIVLPLLLAVRRSAFAERRLFWFAYVAYLAAKGAELADRPVFAFFGGTISGHTLKHLCAAAAVWLFVVRVRRLR